MNTAKNDSEIGAVYLVGAGPGASEALTVRGLELLTQADVVLHDRLVNVNILCRSPSSAEIIDVGKNPGDLQNSQESINRLMIDRALDGNVVVRLKGGDPFIFGRGGEEAEALVSAGVPFEIVPGVTSAIAVPAYAGIPITHRGVSSLVTIVTGSENTEKGSESVNWEWLAQTSGTIVVLMGFRNLSKIACALMRGGKPPNTPVALIRSGSIPTQQTIVGTLSDISSKAVASGLKPPVVTVIGQVVRFRETLRWFDNKPLFGKRVLVTRTRTQASELSELLMREGADPIELPTIETIPLKSTVELDRVLDNLSKYDWILFTSTNTVAAVFDRLVALDKDARTFGGIQIGAIGESTANALSKRGIWALDFIPQKSVSESVVEGMSNRVVPGSNILIPGAEQRNPSLKLGLERMGVSVHDVSVYETVIPSRCETLSKKLITGGVDIATFTSTSTVNNFVDLVDGDLSMIDNAVIACIGPITASAAENRGLTVNVIPKTSTISGLVESLKDHFAKEDLY